MSSFPIRESHSRSLACVAALLVALVAPHFAWAEASAEEWKADRALELAQELEKTLDELRSAAASAGPQSTGMQQRTRDAAAVAMNATYEASHELTKKLRLGWGRKETGLLLAEVQSAYDRALQIAGDASPDPKVAPLLDKSGELLFDLQKLYEPS